MYVTNTHKIQKNKTPSGVSIWWLLTQENGTPHFELRYFELEEGQKTSGNPHPFEHEVYVIKGRGQIAGDNEVVEIKPGDAVLIFPDERHQFVNTGDEVLGFICIIPNGTENHIK
ncbi:MAG: cupin domain-containing protein [Spirochaetota bacterium]|nr:MAG: cupin domain-containing protein [Spirochaetota bacterium]